MLVAERIEINPNVMLGKPVIRGTRIPVELILRKLSEGATEAILVTSGTFTEDAWNFARNKPMKLVEGQELAALIKSVKAVQRPSGPPETLPAPHVSQASEQPPSDSQTPRCPICNAEMVLRIATRGRHIGERFWGCPAFPRCRGWRRMDGHHDG